MIDLAPKTRQGLNLMGLWSVMVKAQHTLEDCASEFSPDQYRIRNVAAELRGATEIIWEIADAERALRLDPKQP